MLRTDLFQSLHKNRLQPGGVARKVFSQDFRQTGEGRSATNRIPGMRARHGTGPELIHYFLTADDCRKRQRTADTLAAADQVGCDSVVFERPELASASKACLHFIEDQDHVVLAAPISHLAHIFNRSEIGANALVGFHHDTGHVPRFESCLLEGSEKGVEPGVLLPITVRERRIDDGRIQIDDP
ncbi:hypothetical protein SDC9_167043 [bioreactor metagenome]|uniref:Uncharacterized protein n=1 Tax=bioreactor metagenome TaxID=1076179 RepID=A0A645FYP2_9ZZZZ